MAGVRSFAHLRGLARPAAAGAEDDECKAKRAEDDDREDEERDDDKKSKRAEDDEREDEERDDDKKSKRADEDDADDDDEGEGDKKKARRADDGDDDDEEMKAMSRSERRAYRSGRAAENRRWATILSSKTAAQNLQLAAHLASKTRMSAKDVIAAVAGAPAPSATNDRSSRNPRLGPSGQPTQTSAHAAQAAWDNAFKRVARK